ncbi:hypothetical protein V2G26_002901 [Clonostachys chloroleuca]
MSDLVRISNTTSPMAVLTAFDNCRLDSQERPFACRVCSKRYARADLVTRHEKTVHKQGLNYTLFGQGFDGDFDAGLPPSFFDPFVGGSFDQFLHSFGADETITEDSFQMAPQSFEDSFHAQSPGIELRASSEAGAWYTRQNSSDYRKQLRAKNTLGLVVTEEIRARCLADLKSHLTTEQIGDFQLPELTSLQHRLDRYIGVFHIHFPFMHLPILDLMSAPSPLILAWRAGYDYTRALVGCDYISADFRLRRSVVRHRERDQCPDQWKQWAAHESMKRYMCTCIILGNLHNIAYGINPGFSMLDECDVEIPGDVEIPEDDELWDATASSQWESLTDSKPRPPLVSLGKEASMFFTDSDRLENLPRGGWSWSPFATSAVIHQVAIAVWYLTQGQQACNQ